MRRAALDRRLAALEAEAEERARELEAERRALDLSQLTLNELHDLEVAMLVEWSGLSEDEAWYAVHDGCCCFHPYDPTDPRTAAAARAAIARRVDFLCGYLPANPRYMVSVELAGRLRDLRVWRRVIARTYELDPQGPSYEGRVAEALREIGSAGEPATA